MPVIPSVYYVTRQLLAIPPTEIAHLGKLGFKIYPGMEYLLSIAIGTTQYTIRVSGGLVGKHPGKTFRASDTTDTLVWSVQPV